MSGHLIKEPKNFPARRNKGNPNPNQGCFGVQLNSRELDFSSRVTTRDAASKEKKKKEERKTCL